MTIFDFWVKVNYLISMMLFARWLKFDFSLMIVLAVNAYLVMPIVDSLALKWFLHDLRMSK